VMSAFEAEADLTASSVGTWSGRHSVFLEEDFLHVCI